MADDVRPPHELQQPLHSRIGDELIELTPEHWRAIKLAVVRTAGRAEALDAFGCTITSMEGHPEAIVPSNELAAMIQELYILFVEHGAQWQSAEYYVRAMPDDAWNVVADFHY